MRTFVRKTLNCTQLHHHEYFDEVHGDPTFLIPHGFVRNLGLGE